MQLEDWLDDLCVRFIINLPREELESAERICFQVEEAQWFYEDFIRPLDPALPSLTLKAFSLRIFQHCPLMSSWSPYHHSTAFSEFLSYKTRVPVRGAILLNEEMDEVVLVKGWKKGANWSFPRGKINKDEKDLDCAIREVYEETGFDVEKAGLVKNEEEVKGIEVSMREQHMRLYVFRGVPRDTHFEARTRKEISKIEWYKLSDLPTLKRSKQHDQGHAIANANKFYMVAPFMNQLKRWIAQQKRLDAKKAGIKQPAEAVDTNVTPLQAPVELAAPSDLPEVASADDASSHLKRLLNIDNGISAQDQSPCAQPSQAPGVDAKSNALLQLLRSGSSNEVPKNEPIPPQPFPAPAVFPGFPPQAYSADQSTLPQTLPPPLPGVLPHLPPLANVPDANQPVPPRSMEHSFQPTAVSSNGYQGLPPFSAQQPSKQQFGEEPSPAGLHSAPASQSSAPAPFQQTGDFQLSQGGQPPQSQGTAVPPASKLPPPKLTSHSLALLNVFKDEKLKTPKVPSATVSPSPGQDTAAKPAQPHDQLLNLLRDSPAPATSASGPVELPAEHTPPPAKQILQRPNEMAKQRTPKGPKSQVQTSATVSGPLSMPQFEGIAKPPVEKEQNGLNRKTSKDRQTQTQPLASPITILPRPQSAKKEQSSTPPAAPQGSRMPNSRTHSQSRAKNGKSIDPSKPFQPQILRRDENPGLDINIPLRPKSTEPGPQNTANQLQPEPEVEPSNIRRPSQTAAQKEALLSLFVKKSDMLDSPASGPLDTQTSVRKPSNSAISLSPTLAPSVRRPVSEIDTQDSTSRCVSTPDNKAFLLGFLEGVAKGNK